MSKIGHWSDRCLYLKAKDGTETLRIGSNPSRDKNKA